ncbi:tyrosinase family protein [Pseudonocardia saturnea]
MAHPVRRNIAHLTDVERQAFINALQQIDLRTFADGVSMWDKQDQIHQSTHNHNGNSFLPWHRELVNRFESYLQQVDPVVALPYWDWTEDPRAASDGQGGTVDLSDDTLMGTMNGQLGGVLASLHNGGALAGSREQTGDPADPPQSVTRNAPPGAPGLSSDATIISSSDGLPQAQQWTAFREALEGNGGHNGAHGYIGGDIGGQHQAFEDPFVFLLHANVDRLFAMWQTQPGQDWRLDPDLIYGDQSTTTDDVGILNNLQPWDGTVQFGAPIEPWVGSSAAIEVKNSRHPSVVRPPCYDTLPLTVSQVAPAPGDPIRFLDVVENLPTARALRLRVLGCRAATAVATVTAPFTLLGTTVLSPEPAGFGTADLLIWVLYSPGAASSSDSGTLTVTIGETGDTLIVPIVTTVVDNPTVGSSLVLDTSGSMSLPSGAGQQTRMDVLRSAAPLFVHLLDDTDGVGVVRFDTDAAEAAAVQQAGPVIGGAGRGAALAAISATTTSPGGLTAIGDGLEAATTQLTPVAGAFSSTATVVFTDGHETADKTIAAVASAIGGRVFAIGLGTADQLNPGALSDIANGTGGYLLLTGNPGPDDQILLQKYFAQVLAGMTNAAIVVDPDGFVPIGGTAAVPFVLTDADIRADVIVLSHMAEVFDVVIIAPDGTTLTTGTGLQEVAAPTYRVLRITPSVAVGPNATAGQWEAVLTVNGDRVEKWIGEYRERLAAGKVPDADRVLERFLSRIEVHGVPFTLTVQARSSLRMQVSVAQGSRLPGTTARLTVSLTDSGVPLDASVKVHAAVTDPHGVNRVLDLVEREPGVLVGDLTTNVGGVYRVLVRGAGADLRGQPFTREELRTVAVWARGDDPSPMVIDGGSSDGLDACGLLRCLLAIDGIRDQLARHKIDPERVLRCVEESCRPR